MYQYSYLIGAIVMLVIWIVLFLWRKDIRKEMLVMSILIGVLALPLNYLYIQDWWHPLTVTGTALGIEDLILGFAGGGIAAVVYEVIFKMRFKKRKIGKKLTKLELILPLASALILFFGIFYLFKISSFYSAVIASIIPIGFIYYKRKDLILDSLASGFLIMFFALPAYWIPELISPGWIASAWYLDKISGILVWGVPLEDVIWWFLVGLFIGPLYEYWQERRLVDKK